jgi:hypothetical protein
MGPFAAALLSGSWPEPSCDCIDVHSPYLGGYAPKLRECANGSEHIDAVAPRVGPPIAIEHMAPGRVTQAAGRTFVDHERPSRMVGNEPVVFRSHAGFEGLKGVSSRWLSQRQRLSSSRLSGGCPSRVNEISAKTARWRRPGFRVVLAFPTAVGCADPTSPGTAARLSRLKTGLYLPIAPHCQKVL